ncbi:MAG: hypothetical protein A3D67_02105 [Candidatus Lloydbacteria bacterium RIFCSPHIGHO2_02_FULL_51_22]|uniref:Uncharacterized protein n=2 Tax=Candidatus Lloydiibacteriota TaxID=1817910 RepID=A0A1G2D824_9BACT|nr:MAG: hypothetical protein A3D67_02105 [Candidatus Lloydbacteria bacterium RIFCSPHIGHO2_02_FULL_51_22]OGZ15202.1 MAG: hypothetical protein A3J08_03035 [Candidatus Lloydbacteria bacterium RIFCSPLOWO2_02_FULL_51_11]
MTHTGKQPCGCIYSREGNQEAMCDRHAEWRQLQILATGLIGGFAAMGVVVLLLGAFNYLL